MEKEKAEILEVTKDSFFLKVEKKAMCGCCQIAALCNKNQRVFKVPKNNLNLQKNDKIEIGVETKKTLAAICLMFVFPLALFVATLAVFSRQGELTSFLLGFTVMAGYYLFAKIFFLKKKKNSIKILKKIENEE